MTVPVTVDELPDWARVDDVPDWAAVGTAARPMPNPHRPSDKKTVAILRNINASERHVLDPRVARKKLRAKRESGKNSSSPTRTRNKMRHNTLTDGLED